MDAQHLTLPADLTKKRRPVKKCLTFPGNYPRHIPVVRCVGTPGLQQAPVFPAKAKRRSIMHLSPDSLPQCKSCISVCSGRESAANAIMTSYLPRHAHLFTDFKEAIERFPATERAVPSPKLPQQKGTIQDTYSAITRPFTHTGHV